MARHGKFTDAEGMYLLSEAVLFRAINDSLIYGPNKRKGSDALDWVFSDEDNQILDTGRFTFNYTCYLLILDKMKVRLYLNWQLDKNKSKLSENEYSKFLEMCSNG